ncbi:hypothetical protein CP985_10305 [Malaciobacter mytili LMG 24559]|uniref:Uncharacterized protein n=1 Tax=Malaciobacter mytili LMG 24559 TaxID=1032238 RepID=A0AAX2AFB2_9BACT|nr:hypothetical protein [Malaciobacter mytili]AXH16427.1 hypothetical protein AMYT_a0129 [Malaciobacter mytili LMG 24559]RXK15087.1 hypothetical protein CP985_10305 [Malaciobacter mytili LMG 24559]
MGYLFFIIIFLIVVIVAYFLYERYTNTRAYRIRKSIKNYNKHLKEQEQKIKKFDDDAKELLSDENKIKEIIRKIHNKEEVIIPIVAFDYIYRMINKISIIDKEGNVKIINDEKFLEFQKTASDLLRNEQKEKDKYALEKSTNKTNKIFDIKKYPDGTIVKKSLINNDITIIKPDGKKYIQNMDRNELIINEPIKDEEKENKNTKNEKLKGKAPQDEISDRVKKLEQENKILTDLVKNKKEDTTEVNIDEFIKLKEEKNKKSDFTNISINETIEINNTNKKNENIEVENIEKVNLEIKEKEVNESDNKIEVNQELINEEININFDRKKNALEELNNKDFLNSFIRKDEQKFNDKINVKKQEKKINKDSLNDTISDLDNLLESYNFLTTKKSNYKNKFVEKKEENKNDCSSLSSILTDIKNQTIFEKENKIHNSKNLVYANQKDIENLFSYNSLMDFFKYLFTISDRRYKSHFINDKKNSKMYISTEIFLFKIYMNVSIETRDTFLKEIKPFGPSVLRYNDDFFRTIIKMINTKCGISFGVKPLYLNEEKRTFFASKKFEFFLSENEEPKMYESNFLIFNYENKVGKELNRLNVLNDEFFDPKKNYFIEKKEQLKKITLKDILDIKG